MKKRKALIFIEDGSFTYDNRVIREASALVDAGWDITVISPRYTGDPIFKCIHDGLRAYYYPKPTFATISGHLIEFIFSLFFGVIFTFWVFIRHGFDVFHACNPMDILWIVALPYKLLGKKFIFDHHDLVPELIMSRTKSGLDSIFVQVFILFEKCSFKLADAVIATNKSYKEIAVSRGGKRLEDVFVVRNGPNLEKFRLVSPAKGIKNKGDILIGYLGNMNPQDGADLLLDAVDEIINKRKISNIKFVFIGGGHSQPILQERSRQNGHGAKVKFTGRIPDNEMLAVLSACDICVQPDPNNPLNDKSTMNKVLEYMALKKPVVAFDLKETRYSCGDAALYVRPNDVHELSEKLVELAGNPALRRKMGRRGKARVENRLSWEYSKPYLESAYIHVFDR